MELEITHSKMSSPVRIASTRFGDLVISREYVWEFPNGLIGLRTFRNWALVNTCDESDSFFMWLHSTTKGDLAVPVMNPFLIFPEYTIRQDEPAIMRLGLREKEVHALVIVTVPTGDPEGITANLAAPLILVPEKRMGWQIILEKGPYRVAQPLFTGRDETYNEGENIVSVGTNSPPVAIIRDPAHERRSQSVIQARVRAEEVVPPPEQGA